MDSEEVPLAVALPVLPHWQAEAQSLAASLSDMIMMLGYYY